MRILMLGNSYTYANNLPETLAELTGAEVIAHTRGGARLAEHLNPKTAMGEKTLAALEKDFWDYVILQEMSNGPITAKAAFLKNSALLCEKIRANGATPIFYATWAYERNGEAMRSFSCSYEEMEQQMYEAYHEAAAANHAGVADVGREFFRLADTVHLYAEDGSHPNEVGSKIAAEVIARVIGKDQKEKARLENRAEVKHFDVKVSDDRLRALYLYQYLYRYSDENHPVTTKQIQDHFQKEYQIKIHRTVVPEYIDLLRAAGIEVVGERKRSFNYHLNDRELSLTSLKLLIDAVQSSKFMTEARSKLLIEQLMHLTCEANVDVLKRNIHVAGRAKTSNYKAFYTLDRVNEALNAGVKIAFRAFDYDGDKKQILKNGGTPYTVSPYDLIWDGDYYYLVGWCDERGEMRKFRIDRMTGEPEILEEAIVPRPRDYSVERYTMEEFRMYAEGDPVDVSLICEDGVMNAVVDHFGLDVDTEKIDEEHFRAKVRVCTGATFYRWGFGWKGRIRIEGPEEVRKEYREMLEAALACLVPGTNMSDK